MPTRILKKDELSPAHKKRQELVRLETDRSVLDETLKGCVRVGIVGCGYWGPNLIRNFHGLADATVASICDLEESRLRSFSRKFPGVRLTTKYQDILKDPTIDAVVIATPISTHYHLAHQALKAGKHVLVEKPLTATVREGSALVRLAQTVHKTLMVGHTFEYNPAVLKIADLLKSGEMGELFYIDSVRVNLGLYQSDGLNVIWDLAPHDISIILRWVGKLPRYVSAWGQSYLRKNVEDVAFIRLEFPDGVMAHMHLSWLAPAKMRRMAIVCNKRMAIYDDLESLEKIKIADQGAHIDLHARETKVGYRLGDIVSPRLDVDEPLARECAHFVDCILHQRTPETDGMKGLQVVRVLEAAYQSLKKGGTRISL